MSSDGTGLEEEVEDGGVSDNSKVSITGEFPIASGAKITIIYILCIYAKSGTGFRSRSRSRSARDGSGSGPLARGRHDRG